jgi:tRNA/tmRNA/rRNA uracil-C5-methylase (TrmA/RlmC/RlmD family)
VLYPAIVGPAWGYRYRARLTVRQVPSKGGILIGFHERRSSYISDMRRCPILPPHVSALLPGCMSWWPAVDSRSHPADRGCGGRGDHRAGVPPPVAAHQEG